jgi:hypothetical protein
MPFYDYRCEKCEHTWEEMLKIKDHKKPEKKPCPKCGEKSVKQIILSVPGFAVDTSMQVTNKATGGFKDVMQKTLSGLKGTKAERYWKNRYGI